MSTSSQHPSSSTRDLTLVVESASGTPEEYFAQVGLSIGKAKSNTIHIDHAGELIDGFASHENFIYIFDAILIIAQLMR